MEYECGSCVLRDLKLRSSSGRVEDWRVQQSMAAVRENVVRPEQVGRIAVLSEVRAHNLC